MSPGGRLLTAVLLTDAERVCDTRSDGTPGLHSAPAQHTIWAPETGGGRLLFLTGQQGSKATRVPGASFCFSQAGGGLASLRLSVPVFKLEIPEAATVCSRVQGQHVMAFMGPCSEPSAKPDF